MPRMSSALGYLVVLSCGLVLGWVARTFRGESSPSAAHFEEDSADVSVDDMEVHVRTRPVAREAFPVVITAIGVTEVAETAKIAVASRAHGRLIAVPGEIGAVVKKGAVVARFESAPLELAVAVADLAVERARTDLESFRRYGRGRKDAEFATVVRRSDADVLVAKAAVDRLAPFAKDSSVAKKSIEDADSTLKRAEMERSVAEAAFEAWRDDGAALEEKSLEAALRAADLAAVEAHAASTEATMTAPADGTIESVPVKLGEIVDSGGTLLVLRTAGPRRVTFDLSQSDAPRVAAGQDVTFIDATGTARHALIARVMSEVEPGTGFSPAQAVIDADVPEMPIGLIVNGEIVVERISDATVVPEKAIVRSDGETIVVVVDGGHRARRVPVEVIARSAGRAAIRAAAAVDGDVIVDGAYNLPDGAHVSIDSETSAPTPTTGPSSGGSEEKR